MAIRMTYPTIIPPPPPMWPWCLWHDDAAERLRALRAAGHSPGCQCGRRGIVGCRELRRRLTDSGRWVAAQ